MFKVITYLNKSQADSGCNLRPLTRKKTSAAGATYLHAVTLHLKFFTSIKMSEKTKYTCKYCKTQFYAFPDHGKPRKYCSRACFCALAVPPVEKKCENCGGSFLFKMSNVHEKNRTCCSRKCIYELRLKKEGNSCAVCNKRYMPRKPNSKTCSKECRDVFYVGENSIGYKKGFYIASDTKQKMMLTNERKGYLSFYTAEHRILISKAINRELERNEIIIHINNSPTDNRLTNLFICSSMSEYSKRRHGSLPWPKKSNIQDFVSQKINVDIVKKEGLP